MGLLAGHRWIGSSISMAFKRRAGEAARVLHFPDSDRAI